MSMPPSSSPSGWPHDGAPKTGPTCVCKSYGAIQGARRAPRMTMNRITAPASAEGRRLIVSQTTPRRERIGSDSMTAPGSRSATLIGRLLADERGEGAWGNREVPQHWTVRRGHVGETWFPPQERAGGERRSFRDPRVEPEVEEIRDQVEEDDRNRQHQEGALQHRVVALEHGVVHSASDAGPRKDGLDQDRTGD